MNKCARSTAFAKLKPLLIKFLADCSIENIKYLEEEVKKLDPLSVQLLQEFIIVPFRAHLNGKLSENITIKCIEFLTLVFKRSYMQEWRLFYGHFAQMISKFCDPEDVSKTIRTRSEELKISICENLLWLVRCSSTEVLNEMYSLAFRPRLAYAFFIFNILLMQEKSKTLLEAVLATIGALTYREKYFEKKCSITEQIASEVLASCLPGLSITMQKVICNDKQNHSVITKALSVLTDLIILTVGDESFERGIAKNSSCSIYRIAYTNDKESYCNEQVSDSIPVVIKDEAWFINVAEKLEHLIQNVTLVSSHNHWKVRLKYLKCTKSLLFKCTKTLKTCIPVLLPTVFGLSIDDNENVSSVAKCLLVSLSELSENNNCISLKSVVDDNIKKLIADLIKFKFSANDDKKLATLKNLLGYIEISGSSLIKSFPMIHFERIILTLITLLEFDISESNFVQEIPYTDVENFDIINPLFPKKKFKFFNNEKILNIICELCYCLGHIGNSRLLIDYLLDKLSVNNLSTLQCIFVIGSIIKGLSNELVASEEHSILINDVLEVFLSNILMDVPTHKEDEINLEVNRSSMDLDITNNIYNKNKIQVCLLLEAIARCSECLRTNFKLQLMKVLCPVMEKAGSSNFIISQCGKLCLYYIAKSCEYESVKELIKDNADYITNILLINFHQYLYKPEMVVVLRVAIEQSDAEALLLFRDLIFKILNILDYNQNKAYSLMIVLNSVVMSIRKWFPCKKDSHNSNCLPIDTSHKSLRSLVSDYIDLKKTKIELENDENNTQNISNTVCEDINTEDSKPDIPLHVNIICDIFKRCTLLQSSENKYLRMLSLETVELCILVLRDHENQLLPLVHEFWSPFLRRFSEDTFTSKAFNVLLTISNECGDFIRQRSLKDIMPKVVLFLQKEFNKSLLKCNFKHYQWTSDHALQVLVLSEIGNFCTKISIDDKEINVIANACLPYMQKKQPKILQDAAIKSLKALTTINPDSMYFYWNVLYCKEKTLIPSSKNLLELHFPFSNNSLTSTELFKFLC